MATYAGEALASIEDVTPFVRAQQHALETHGADAVRVPVQRV